MNEPDDTQLASACLEGDSEAFSTLVDRHRDAVYHLAYRLCGEAATAEDLAQEAFIRAYRKLHQYKPGLSFRNWVLGICAHLARSGYRRRSRKLAIEQTYAREQVVLREETAETEAARDRNAHMLERALQSLPTTLRAPVVLKYMEGLSVQEVAQTLGIRLSAAKMRLARGRARLESLVREQAEKEDEP